jgi:P27 family predicted phage terminase small subunit
MGIPGRKPNPRKQKDVKEKPADPLIPDEPFASEADTDTSCPPYLDRYGKGFWNEYVPRLAGEGVFKNVDRPAFEAMADCYSQFRRAQKVIKKEGMTFETPNGYIQQRPEVGIATKAKEQLRLMMAEFGMTASSRKRIGVSGGEGSGDGEDWGGTGLDK